MGKEVSEYSDLRLFFFKVRIKKPIKPSVKIIIMLRTLKLIAMEIARVEFKPDIIKTPVQTASSVPIFNGVLIGIRDTQYTVTAARKYSENPRGTLNAS